MNEVLYNFVIVLKVLLFMSCLFGFIRLFPKVNKGNETNIYLSSIVVIVVVVAKRLRNKDKKSIS